MGRESGAGSGLHLLRRRLRRTATCRGTRAGHSTELCPVPAHRGARKLVHVRHSEEPPRPHQLAHRHQAMVLGEPECGRKAVHHPRLPIRAYQGADGCVRERVIAQLRNVSEDLARNVAQGLGMSRLPDRLPTVLKRAPKPEVGMSKALSLFARPGQDGIKTRRIALILANGVASSGRSGCLLTG
jgi:hypothetical protein